MEKWLLFLANNDPLELEEIAMKDENITKALEAEKKFLSDDQARYIYELREKGKRDWISGMKKAEKRGMKIGIEQGIEQGKFNKAIVIAEKLLAKGAEIKEVAEMTELPESEILKLLKQ